MKLRWSLRSMFIFTFIVALVCMFQVPKGTTYYYIYRPSEPHKVQADDHMKAVYWGPFKLWTFEPRASTADWRDMTSEEERDLRESDSDFWKTQRKWRSEP